MRCENGEMIILCHSNIAERGYNGIVVCYNDNEKTGDISKTLPVLDGRKRSSVDKVHC